MENNPPLQVLKRRSEFENLKQQGKKLRPRRWLLVSYSENQQQQFRCGWTVSKRNGSAVVRNQLKRWCREYFRKHSVRPSVDMNVVFLNPTKDKNYFKRMDYSEFADGMSYAWQKIVKA